MPDRHLASATLAQKPVSNLRSARSLGLVLVRRLSSGASPDRLGRGSEVLLALRLIGNESLGEVLLDSGNLVLKTNHLAIVIKGALGVVQHSQKAGGVLALGLGQKAPRFLPHDDR